MADRSEVLISIKNLNKEFKSNGKTVHAVNNVSLDIYKGETLGLVGESGCGKSTLGNMLVHLHTPTSGDIFYEGREISRLSSSDLRMNMGPGK